MQKLRLTTAKTRIGILKWIAKLNPQFTQDYFTTGIYETALITAVHINKHTGALVAWEYASGKVIPLYSLTPAL